MWGAALALGVGIVVAIAAAKGRRKRRHASPQTREPLLFQVVEGGGSREAPGADLAFGLEVPEDARTFVAPSKLIWSGLPTERAADLQRLFPAPTEDFDSPQSVMWARRIIEATKRGQRWFHGSDGRWGRRELEAVENILGLLDYWIVIGQQTVELTTRQIGDLRGAYPPRIRAAGNAYVPVRDRRYAIVIEGLDPLGLRQRWPIEVHISARALALELEWAREAFKRIRGILEQVVSGAAFVRTASGYRFAAEVNDLLDALVGFGTGLRGPGVELGMPHRYAAQFAALSGDVDAFAEQSQALLEVRDELQDEVLRPIEELVQSMADAVSEDLRAALPFVDTLAAGLSVTGPWGVLAGIVIEFVQAWIDIIRGTRHEREREFSIGALPRAPEVFYTHRGIETYLQLTYRALHAQEVRIAQLVSGDSWLLRDLGPHQARD